MLTYSRLVHFKRLLWRQHISLMKYRSLVHTSKLQRQYSCLFSTYHSLCSCNPQQPKLLQCKRNFSQDGGQNNTGDEGTDVDTKYSEMFSEQYLLPKGGQRVFVIQPIHRSQDRHARHTQLQLDESCTLATSLPGWTVAEQGVYSVRNLSPKTLFGKGTFATIKEHIRDSKGVSAVFINVDILTQLQLQHMQDSWRVAVYDRYTVVLQIFKLRAQTKEAKLQVELAQIPYYRTRLRGMHEGLLGKQSSGLAYVGGSGETYRELRYRILKEKEAKILKMLNDLRDQRAILRKSRVKKEFPVVAVVGYTNAGKTSLIRALSGDLTMQPEDRLFATLDVTVHAGLLPNRLKVLYVDTVGFISNIPTSLIQSFRATLEDINAADVIIHVRDVSHPAVEDQQREVVATLEALQLPTRLTDSLLEVANKVDLLESRDDMADSGGHLVSVATGEGLPELKLAIQQAVIGTTGRIHKRLKVPLSGDHLRWLHKEATVEQTLTHPDDTESILVEAVLTPAAYAKFVAQFGKPRKVKKIAR